MTADGFDALATHFTDRTVVTYDRAARAAASAPTAGPTTRRSIRRTTCTY
jgi:hypothetical protein